MTSAYHENAALIGPVRAAWFHDQTVHLVVSTAAWALCGMIDSRGGKVTQHADVGTGYACVRCFALRFGAGELEG